MATTKEVSPLESAKVIFASWKEDKARFDAQVALLDRMVTEFFGAKKTNN